MVADGPQPISVRIPGDALAASGTQTFKLDGADAEGGTVTAKWKFSVQ